LAFGICLLFKGWLGPGGWTGLLEGVLGSWFQDEWDLGRGIWKWEMEIWKWNQVCFSFFDVLLNLL
jgi:hypothetical protein